MLSHGAWTAQRAVAVDRWICIRTYHDAFHGFPDVMLFDLETDPHEQHDLAADRPTWWHGLARLRSGRATRLDRSATGVDPLWTVLTGGGPWHTASTSGVSRPAAGHRTGRWADRFAARDGPGREGDPRGFLDP